MLRQRYTCPKSAHRGSQSAVSATKSARRDSPSAVPVVHKALCLSRNLHIEVHKALCLSRNLHVEVHKVLCLSRNLHVEVDKVLCLTRNLQSSHMWKSYDSLHLSRNQSASSITTMSKVLHQPLRSLAPVTKSPLWSTKTRGFPCACHEKSPSCAKIRTAPQRERSRYKHPPPAPRFREPAQSKCTLTMSKGMNVL